MSYSYEGYSGRSDSDLNKDFIYKHANVYVARHGQQNKTATLDLTTPSAATLTIASTSISDDDYNSGYIFITNDSSAGCVFTVSDSADNAGDAVFTFDATSDIEGVDESSNLTDGGSYDITVTHPKEYIGYANDPEFAPNAEYGSIDVDMPKVTKLTYKTGESPILTLTLLSTPLTLLQKIFSNPEDADASPDTWYKHDTDAERTAFYIRVENIRTVDSNQTVTQHYFNSEFEEPNFQLGGRADGSATTFELTADIFKDAIVGTNYWTQIS
jgi:hypothetical protein